MAEIKASPWLGSGGSILRNTEENRWVSNILDVDGFYHGNITKENACTWAIQYVDVTIKFLLRHFFYTRLFNTLIRATKGRHLRVFISFRCLIFAFFAWFRRKSKLDKFGWNWIEATQYWGTRDQRNQVLKLRGLQLQLLWTWNEYWNYDEPMKFGSKGPRLQRQNDWRWTRSSI